MTELAPKDTSFYIRKGDFLYELGNYRRAFLAYEQAIELDPTYAPAYYGKARALEHFGTPDAYQEAYATARRLGYKE